MLRELDNIKAGQPQILSTIKALRICMTNLPISWVVDFRDHNGLKSLLTLMRRCVEDPLIDDQIQLESIRTLNSFMNNKYGLNAVLESKQAMRKKPSSNVSQSHRSCRAVRCDTGLYNAMCCLVVRCGARWNTPICTAPGLPRAHSHNSHGRGGAGSCGGLGALDIPPKHPYSTS